MGHFTKMGNSTIENMLDPRRRRIDSASKGWGSCNLGGLQADLMGGSGGAEPPGKYIHHPGVGMGLIKAIATAG